jgi:hypothetical protein
MEFRARGEGKLNLPAPREVRDSANWAPRCGQAHPRNPRFLRDGRFYDADGVTRRTDLMTTGSTGASPGPV